MDFCSYIQGCVSLRPSNVCVNISIVSSFFFSPEIEHIWRQGLHKGTETEPLSSILPADHHYQRTNGRGWAPAFQSEPGSVQHLGAKAPADPP